MSDTIYALATAPGRSGVAVVRISGPGAGEALGALGGALPTPRLASLRRLKHPNSADLLDEALVLWMPGPASFTGEDVVELHLHGGRAVINAVLSALAALGLRPADPGEFTRRAFERGRMDLSEAEAVADLVDAETQAQRRQALEQLGGSLARRTGAWREALIEALAGLEAAIDFPDEDLPETVVAMAVPPLRSLLADLQAAAADPRGRRVREGVRVAIVGAPNAGKSTLLNLLAGREAAIVTDTPGTTRDVIEVVLDIQGYRVLLADTAGIRDATDLVEQEGVRRALAQSAEADLRLWVVDQHAADGSWEQAAGEVRDGDAAILMKSDLGEGHDAGRARARADEIGAVLVCEDDRGGADQVLAFLQRRVLDLVEGRDAPATSRERHRIALESASGHLQRALASTNPELMAEDVRLAAKALQTITGSVDSEAVLDRIFAAFCVGK